MNPDRLFRGLVGFMVLLSAALAYFVSPWWLILTAVIGFMLFQSSITNWCPGLSFAKKICSTGRIPEQE